MMEKVDVNGKDAHPIFNLLKRQEGGFLTDGIKWNFTKILVNKEGDVVGRYGSTTKPEALSKDIEKVI